MTTYEEFIKSKVRLASKQGVEIDAGEVNPRLKPHQQAIVRWLVAGGRRACFAAFGLGKSIIQLETVRLTLAVSGGRGLIVCPLNVKQEFIRDSQEILGWKTPPKFIRSIDEADETGIYLTNYETVRDGKLDPSNFQVASLDEAAILRGFGGTKTFRECMRLFTGDAGPAAKMRGVKAGGVVQYRFVATATPSPNEYIELLAYADFLGVMDTSQAKTRFFKRDSTKADKLTLHPHKEREFWLWVASWAIFVQKPSDLGFSDDGYDMPPLQVHWHEVQTDHSKAGFEKSGQSKMFRDSAIGLQDAAAEKRISLPCRIEKLLELRALEPNENRIVWHDLEAERHAIEKSCEGIYSVYGNQDIEEREKIVAEFSNGLIKELAAKPVMLGSGCNLQRHCSRAVFLGIGFKFNDFIQAIHRIYRFLQNKTVRIDLIYTEAEREIKKQLERKWAQHNEMVKQMTNIIKEFGLSHAAMAAHLTRKMGVERVEITGKQYRIVNNDCVQETRSMAENSVGLMLTSIPFSTQYEYSPNYCDFGHSEGNEEFFGQMDYLTPELLRVLKPGRILAVHVKDRIVPGGMTGLGFQTVYPFHARCIEHYAKHGFGYMGMKTIVTDVVRENNQTYRLGWTEQCKDGTKMGVGMPEYLLLFRKPQSSAEKSYADEPVVKNKAEYTRSRWQIDAHGFTRSNGNRLLNPEELKDLPHDAIFQIHKQFSLETVYDFEHHVKVGEALELEGRLPVTFMLLQPQSWHEDVWTDITRMLTLNGAQSASGKEMHLCPMQFDIADRVISQMSNPGDIVFDPFAGLMTVPYRAIKLGRIGVGCELNPAYFTDGAAYCKAAEMEASMPTLFDLDKLQQA
jgi:DNA modification methylase